MGLSLIVCITYSPGNDSKLFLLSLRISILGFKSIRQLSQKGRVPRISNYLSLYGIAYIIRIHFIQVSILCLKKLNVLLQYNILYY